MMRGTKGGGAAFNKLSGEGVQLASGWFGFLDEFGGLIRDARGCSWFLQ